MPDLHESFLVSIVRGELWIKSKNIILLPGRGVGEIGYLLTSLSWMVQEVLVNYTFNYFCNTFTCIHVSLPVGKRKGSALFMWNLFTYVQGNWNVRCEYVKIQWQLINGTTILPSKL